jgi:LCP family protein required for cell wall assembly
MFNDGNVDDWTRDLNYQYNDKEQNAMGDANYLSEIIPNIASMNDEYSDNIDWDVMSDSLSQQVNEELKEENLDNLKTLRKKMIRKRILIATGSVMGVLLCCATFFLGTKPGRKILYKLAGSYIYGSMDTVSDVSNTTVVQQKSPKSPKLVKNQNIASAAEKNGIRQEPYVTNFLIFGIEEHEHAKNTDSMLIASINTKDKSIKLTSLMRDTYIADIPGRHGNKLNSVFVTEGADGLVDIIENNYKIHIDGYAYVNYSSFEKIVNYLGGVTLELGRAEAAYLDRTNYIENPAYRTLKPGINKLNGNQLRGYCRVRYVPTLEGVNNDYGRTLRQRKALKAIFEKYKNQGMLDLLSVTKNCLGYVKTNVTQQQVEKAIEDVVENKITKLDSYRIPADGKFEDPKIYEGITYPLVLDWDENVKELYKDVYLDKDPTSIPKPTFTPTSAPSATAAGNSQNKK